MKLRRWASSRLSSLEHIALEGRYNCNNYAPLPYVIERAKGPYMWDVEGKRYLDCIGAYSAVSQGHMHPKIKQAMVDQLDRIALTSRAVFNDQLGGALQYLCETFNYDRAIMMNTGVEACETGVKFARRWAYEVKKVPSDQAWILFASNNFWGRTIAACGASDSPDRFYNFGPFGLNFKILPFNDADAFERELQQNPNVAAIMLEPIQGEAGVVIPDKDFLPRIRQMCDKYNTLMFLDEVQTGLGRTGTMLAQEHWNVKADLVALGKALSGGFMPVSAVLGRKEIFDCIRPGDHGSTFGGNPLACQVMRKSIEVIFEEKMCENAAKQGEFFLRELSKVLKEFPFTSGLRGKGLFFAFDVDQNTGPDMKKLLYRLADNGLLAKNTKTDRIRFAPPLIINDQEAQFIVDMIRKSLKDSAQDMSAK